MTQRQHFFHNPTPPQNASLSQLSADGWLTSAALKRRGWTWVMIRDLLGEGLRRPNPLGEHELRLYRIEEVEAAEAQPSFGLAAITTAEREKFAPTRETLSQPWAKKEKQQRKAIAWQRVMQGDFEIPQMTRTSLMNLSNQYAKAKRIRCNPHSTRQQLNTLRHNASLYDLAVEGASHEQRAYLLQVLLSACAISYPHLEEECQDKLDSTGEGLSLLPAERLPGPCGKQALQVIAERSAAIEWARKKQELHSRKAKDDRRRNGDRAVAHASEKTLAKRLTKKQLKARGWTKPLIEQLLSEPIETIEGGQIVRRWTMEEVLRAETDRRFQKGQTRRTGGG